MASSYKYLGNNDRVVSTTELLESVSNNVSSSTLPSNKTTFVKVVSGSSSTNILDITAGRSSACTSGSSDLTKQQIVYNQMAKVLIGLDVNNNVKKFSLDANAIDTDNILHNAFFINLARNQFKDKIKKGTFELLIKPNGTLSVYLTDKSGSLGPTVRECETGEYGILYVSASSTTGLSIATNRSNLTGGLVFYEAGVAVVSPYLFAQSGTNAEPTDSTGNFNENQRGLLSTLYSTFSGSQNVGYTFVSGGINDSAVGLYKNFFSASYQSVTELNSTVYFCRAFNNEFNYSSNPTYLTESQIVVKEGDPMAQPASYITTVGLYDDNNQLLAVAKLSEPIKKTPDTELITRVRLDF
jgi:hypothetical protein